MKKIVDYKVVRFSSEARHSDSLVREAILKGWQPYGELIVDVKSPTTFTYYHQAMVKYAEE